MGLLLIYHLLVFIDLLIVHFLQEVIIVTDEGVVLSAEILTFLLKLSGLPLKTLDQLVLVGDLLAEPSDGPLLTKHLEAEVILLPLKLSNQVATLLEGDALEVSLEARAAKVLLGAVGHDLHVRDILAKERVLIRGSGVAITIAPPKVMETRVLQLGLVLVTES